MTCRMKYNCAFVLLVCLSNTVKWSCGVVVPNPVVYWSMDKIHKDFLRPDIGDSEAFSADLLNPSDIETVPGFHGTALRIGAHTEVIIGTVQTSYRNCFTDPANCQETGISFGAWLNLPQGNSPLDCIFTGASTCGATGVSLYQRTKNTIYAVVRFTNGTYFTSECSFNANQWTHLGVTWDAGDGIKMYLDGAPVTTYTSSPARDVSVSGSSQRHMKLGSKSNNSSFTIDDLKLWHRALDAYTMSLVLYRLPATFIRVTTTDRPVISAETPSSHVVPTTKVSEHVTSAMTVNTTGQSDLMVTSAGPSAATNTSTSTGVQLTNSSRDITTLSGASETESINNQTTLQTPKDGNDIPRGPALWILVGVVVFVLPSSLCLVIIICGVRNANQRRDRGKEDEDFQTTQSFLPQANVQTTEL